MTNSCDGPYRHKVVFIGLAAPWAVAGHLLEHLVATGAWVTVVDNLATGNLEHLQAVLPRVKRNPGGSLWLSKVR